METQLALQAPKPDGNEDLTREERIKKFNEKVDQALDMLGAVGTSLDFCQKLKIGTTPSLQALMPITLSELKMGTTHRGRVVFCRIATRCLVMKSSAVLVEDDSGMANLAVYNLNNVMELSEGRQIAIMEPHYKIRADGTAGIRVDDPNDIIFDPDAQELGRAAQFPCGRPSAEERLHELLSSNETFGVNRLYQTLVDEGYRINKKQVKALKGSYKGTPGGSPPSRFTPILSERQPEKDRIIHAPHVLAFRDAGNEAFNRKDFGRAEKNFSAALDQSKNCNLSAPFSEGDEAASVNLWQLYSNRSAARMRLGMLDEALRDSLASNQCAPVGVVKPILRCAEALVALGLQSEANDLLKAAVTSFPEAEDIIKTKMERLAPATILRVGSGQQYKTIASAIQAAPSGSEILVDEGVYAEPLVFSKPLTLRSTAPESDFDALRSLDTDGKDIPWAKIEVRGDNAIVCATEEVGTAVCIIGFQVVCRASSFSSLHAAFGFSGILGLRNCWLTSSSGPVIAAINATTRVIVQACAVVGGSQGGILVAEDAHLCMKQTHCCRQAANGLELREGGSAFVDGSHFYANGRQGIMVWKSAGRLTAKGCVIHSHSRECGALVGEAEAHFENCRVFGNDAAGIAAQQKGSIFVRKCQVHDNCEGILIQDTGSGMVEQCDVYSNRSNGIFVGYDHRGSASIINNQVHGNVYKGILIGSGGNVVVSGNNEYGNKGLPPAVPKGCASSVTSRIPSNFLKNMKKNKTEIEKAMNERVPCSFFDELVESCARERGGMFDVMTKGIEQLVWGCASCDAMPEPDARFPKCSRCRAVSYCSVQCQKKHWPKHKAECKPKPVKYPSFVDSQTPV